MRKSIRLTGRGGEGGERDETNREQRDEDDRDTGTETDSHMTKEGGEQRHMQTGKKTNTHTHTQRDGGTKVKENTWIGKHTKPQTGKCGVKI